MQKQKLSIDSQIAHMKNEKGILFSIISEADAREFLLHNNYYFRVKSYAKNYEKYKAGPKAGKYINLEFAYLVELSTIDMYLRKLLFHMTLDIEHYLKTQLLRDFEANTAEDGYEIVKLFLSQNNTVISKIEQQKKSYCQNLIRKYENGFALWNIVEILSFGDFIQLYKLYYTLYPSKENMSDFLLSAKVLRNATAHNNCLLNCLKKPYHKQITPNKKVITYLDNVDGIGPELKMNKMTNAVIHDIVVSIHLFCLVASSQQVKDHTLSGLRGLVHKRMGRHRHYFTRNEEIKSNYWFLRKVIDFYSRNGISY